MGFKWFQQPPAKRVLCWGKDIVDVEKSPSWMFFGVWHDEGAQNDETVVMRLLPRLDRSPVPD